MGVVSGLMSWLVKVLGSVPPTFLVLAVATGWLLHYNIKRWRMVQLINKIPGLPALPFLGNSLEVNVDHDEIFQRLTACCLLWGRREGFCKGWFGPSPYVFISKAPAVEAILSSPKHIEKSQDYKYLHPWLGTGLLTSSGQKWFSRRKMLTPAFHFRILDDFVEVFREQSDILAQKLLAENGGKPFNIFPYITLCALDIVCETAMGKNINAQGKSDSEYVKAVYKIGEIIQTRQAKMWLQPEILFRLSKSYKEHKNCIDILHGFSNAVIAERKQEVKARKQDEFHDETVLGQKKRLAFLDLLIEASNDGEALSNEDIREEVDTFMFEGHDTTSAAISWSLFLIGHNKSVQEQIVAELESIFGDSNRPFTMKDLHNMKYLECCIKEALRLYPSVPLFARQLSEDVQLGPYTVPAGTTAMILAYQLHRDPEVFPNPDIFNPDNFLPERCQGRHPYAYVPFSAGPRNCIGQKFALLEEKAVLSTVLRNFRIESVDRREDLTLLGELILRPKNGLKVRIYPRK